MAVINKIRAHRRRAPAWLVGWIAAAGIDCWRAKRVGKIPKRALRLRHLLVRQCAYAIRERWGAHRRI